MGTIKALGDKAFRDFKSDGVPATGVNQPDKAEIREFVSEVDRIYQAGLGGGGITFDTLSQANSRLGTIGDGDGVSIVLDGANNGFYVKQAGSLVKKSDATLTSLNQRAKELENATIKMDAAPQLLVAIVDSEGRRSWLEARLSDGFPTDEAKFAMRTRLEEDLSFPSLKSYPGLIAAITDSNDLMTWLTVRETDGQFPEWVIEQMAQRLMPYWGPFHSGLAAGARYVRGSEILPISTDTLRISGWGSSSIERSASALSAMASSLGSTYYSGGNGGVRTQHTAARFGSIPALLTISDGQIPAAGPVNVTSINLPVLNAMQSFTGTLAGVRGVLSSNSTTLTFTRSEAGDAVSIDADTPFFPDVGPTYRNSLALLWMGKNNITGVGTGALVIEQTDATFDWLSPLVRRALVMGHFCNRDTAVISEVRDEIYTVNAAHKARYGDLYIDVHAYVTGTQVWVDMSIAPTADDLTSQSIGNIPPSLAADNGHLTQAAYGAVVNNLIRPRLISLGWF